MITVVIIAMVTKGRKEEKEKKLFHIVLIIFAKYSSLWLNQNVLLRFQSRLLGVDNYIKRITRPIPNPPATALSERGS
jgi:hypothetical protein